MNKQAEGVHTRYCVYLHLLLKLNPKPK